MKTKTAKSTKTAAIAATDPAKIHAEIRDGILQFRQNMDTSARSLRTAATIYANLVALYPAQAKKAFREAFPTITDTTWDRMVDVGTGKVAPLAMLLSTSYTYHKLAALPMDKQRRILGRKMLIARNGKAVEARVGDLAEHELAAALDGNGDYRGVKEQVAFLAARRGATREDAKKNMPTWCLVKRGKELFFSSTGAIEVNVNDILQAAAKATL